MDAFYPVFRLSDKIQTRPLDGGPRVDLFPNHLQCAANLTSSLLATCSPFAPIKKLAQFKRPNR